MISDAIFGPSKPCLPCCGLCDVSPSVPIDVLVPIQLISASYKSGSYLGYDLEEGDGGTTEHGVLGETSQESERVAKAETKEKGCIRTGL